MIRWSYLLPRVLIVVAIVVGLRYVLSPVISYVVIQSIQAATGAKVDLATVEVGFFPPRLHGTALQIANPKQNKELRNLASAQTVELSIDGDALLRRRYVISTARIKGLEIDSDRLSSGHLEPVEQPESTEPSLAMQWLSDIFGSATDAAKDQLDALADRSETLRRGDQIRRRWKSEYGMLASRAAELEAAIKEVQQTAKGIENPLRDWPQIDATLSQAKEIQQELLLVRKTLAEMPAQFQADLLTMERAKQADLQRVRDTLPFDPSAGEDLGPGLLLQVVKAQIAQLRGYLDTGREISEWTVIKPKVERHRGEHIHLVAQQPAVLVRHCELSGLLRSGGKPYELTGILENLTPQAKLRQDPLRARLRLQGEETVRLEYVRDDSAEIAHELLTMHWPEIEAPTLRLGSSDNVKLNVRDGRLELWIQLDTRGEQMSGRVVSRRAGTRIELQGAEKVARTPMFGTLHTVLAGIDQIEIDARFQGTWNDWDVNLGTNLTGILNTAVREAAALQIADTRAKLEAEVNRIHARELAELQEWLVSQQTKSNELLTQADSTVQEISRKVLSETGKADAYIGRLRGNLPGLK